MWFVIKEGELVEPVSLTLGAVAAAMVAKAAEKAAEQAVGGAPGVLGQLVGWLKQRFSNDNDDEKPVAQALSRVEDAPDSPSRIEQLASVLDAWANADPGFRDELRQLVNNASTGGVDVGSIAQNVWGNQNVTSAGVTGSDIFVTYYAPPSSGQ